MDKKDDSDAEIYSLFQYRQASIILDDLFKLMEMYDIFIRHIEPFRLYKSGNQTLQFMKEQRDIVRKQYAHYSEIYKNKGKVK